MAEDWNSGSNVLRFPISPRNYIAGIERDGKQL
jgi:hypothetical protein